MPEAAARSLFVGRVPRTRYSASNHVFDSIIRQSAPSAVQWSIDCARREGKMRLGPLELASDGLAWNRFAAYRRWSGRSWLLHVLLGLLTVGAWWAMWLVVVGVRLKKGWKRVGFSQIRGISYDRGSVKFETDEGIYRILLRRVPNGTLLFRILQGIAGVSLALNVDDEGVLRVSARGELGEQPQLAASFQQ